ncbi:MAG: PAS domain-containing protein [Gammaproteobacteria bacterium]|nr:PAS domain-containing protein [Gammaproteobacteria bacterium]
MTDKAHLKRKNVMQLEDMIANMPCNVYWKDSNGLFVWCNKNQLKAAGLEKLEDIVGKSDYDLIWREDADFLRRIDKEVMESGMPKTLEEMSCTISSNGKRFIYLSHKVPLYDSDGDLLGILGISYDITERKEREKKLAAEKNQLESAEMISRRLLAEMSYKVTGMEVDVNMSPEELAKFMCDYLENIIAHMPGNVYWKNRDSILLGCNNTMAKLAGLKSPQEIVGKSDYELPWKAQAGILREIDKRVMETGVENTIEEPSASSDSDGKVLTYLSKKVPLYDPEGQSIGILGISIDITERKKLEEELQQAEVLAKSQDERIKGTKGVLASVAHELRTPLSSIYSAAGIQDVVAALADGYNQAKAAGLSVERLRPGTIDRAKESLASIEREVKFSQRIINMLLKNVSALETGKDSYKLCSMTACVEAALGRYTYSNDAEGDLVHANLSQDFQFYGEELLVNHIIFNLLKNALYYVARAGKGEITIWLEPGEKVNLLYFKDTGSGIAEDELPHIFEQFFTRTEHGTGVGLSFCKMAMQNMGGDIECRSILSEYTEFVLSFPVAPR